MKLRLPCPRPGVRALVGAIVCLSALAVSALAQDITASVSPNIVTVGEPATYTITFHNSSAPRQISPPSVDGLQFRGPSFQSSFNSVNGRMTSSASLSYSVFPQRPGTYSIAPPPFDHDGRRITLDPVTLDVRAASAPTPDSPDGPVPIRLRATLEPASPYIHQSARFTLEILSLPNVNLDERFDLLPATLPATSCVRSDFIALDPDRIEADGAVYDRRRFQAVVRFTSAGTYTLTPGLRGNVLTRAEQPARRRGGFDDFFGDSWPFGGPTMTATPVEVSVPEPLAVTVRPVPTANRPADYSGAVGRFSFTASATPSEVAVGEPVTVSIALSGDGNIADVRPPFYADTPAYKAYDAKLAGDAPAPTAPQGTKRFDQVVMPRTDALMELPALAFVYFDPAAEAFRTLTAGPFPLRVTPPTDASASSALLLAPSANASAAAAPSAPAALVLATDIHYLKPIPAAPSLPLRLDAALRRPAVLVPAVLAPPAFLFLLWLFRRRHDRLASDTAALRRHAAPRSARRHIRAAETALRTSSPPSVVAAHLSAAISSYFAHRLNLPPGAADTALVRDTLRAAPDAASDLPAWDTLLDLIDHIRYASLAPTPDELESAISDLALLLRHAERIHL